MDKNEYNLKLQEIEKYVDQENYEVAAETADTVDWKRVRNVRTLCMVSEIYEAEHRYEDSKALLLMAYKRSPVGRTILYRLVEVCIHLKQFDEAIEYYSEYVQAAPHDNNRYILKYKIYRGRGSSLDEQIAILKEYLDQEYNEKYAYELAKLYREADRIQECLTTCDDLVLWFHSGKYVIKALELKMRYAPLTPKQQEIYDHRFDARETDFEPEEDEEENNSKEPELGNEKVMVDTSNPTLAETIVENTERSIARDVSVAAGKQKKAGLQGQQAAESTARRRAAENAVSKLERKLDQTSPMDTGEIRFADAARPSGNDSSRSDENIPAAEGGSGLFVKTTAEADAAADRAISETAEELSAGAAEAMEEKKAAARSVRYQDEESAERNGAQAEAAVKDENMAAAAGQRNMPKPAPQPEISLDEVQDGAAKNLREITSGISDRDTEDPDEAAMDRAIEESKREQQDEIKAAREEQMNFRQRFSMPDLRKKATAGQVTIDDVLLSMGERGDAVREAAAKARANRQNETGAVRGGVLSAVDEALLNMGIQPHTEEKEAEKTAYEEPVHTVPDTQDLQAAFSQEAGAQEEENTGKEPEADESAAEIADAQKEMSEYENMKAVSEHPEAKQNGAEEEDEKMKSILSAKTRIFPVDEIASLYERMPLSGMQKNAEGIQSAAAQEIRKEAEEADRSEESPASLPKRQTGSEEAGNAGCTEEAGAPSEENLQTGEPGPEEQTAAKEESGEIKAQPETAGELTEITGEDAAAAGEAQTPSAERNGMNPEDGSGQEDVSAPKVPAELRGLFRDFLEIPHLDSQIAYAIENAVEKGTDRTSRAGNVLIFGGHGCGKTTIAMGIAKAVAKERGSEYIKMARIYATDLNRKDIPATIAKIAGGVLIVEEAGDLSDTIADQLTTAMEFRTDGLIIILEDEQKYIHELLMRHPRFTMKFTSQIYIPEFSDEDLLRFAQSYADTKGYALSESGKAALLSKLKKLSEDSSVSITSIDECLDNAFVKSNKLGRRLFGGKNRYDEENRIILNEKDFK